MFNNNKLTGKMEKDEQVKETKPSKAKIAWHLFRLMIATEWADVKYLIKPDRYYILPDEKEKLLVLSYGDIAKLMSIGKIEFRAIERRKVYTRRKKNGHVKRVTRVKIIGRKAFGVSRMRKDVTVADLKLESFYYTPDEKGRFGLTKENKELKKQQWIKYLKDVYRAKQNR